MTHAQVQFDEIGYWSEIKLDIIKDYASAYSTILAGHKRTKLSHAYIDGFAGAGVHISRATGDFVQGSPLNALNITPPFQDYYLVDLDGDKVEHLRALVGDRPGVQILHGDCNQVLLDQVFPQVRFEDYRRGLCVLDPYGLQLNWGVIETAGKMGSLEIFLNFPVMDMNRNALWRNPENVPEQGQVRMTAFWGDESWRTTVYKQSRQMGLFGQQELEKADNREVAEAYRRRLREVAGFKCVPEPLPMRNTKGAVVYYLFFASQNDTGLKIVSEVFDKYRRHGD
jgi:three-Cys-motif partner protein